MGKKPLPALPKHYDDHSYWLPEEWLSQARACQLRVILLWICNGLRYMYGSKGLNGRRLARTAVSQGYVPKGKNYEH
jgi:hypothetical protein